MTDMLQQCSGCESILIIGLTAELVFDHTDAPCVECLNCGRINEPKANLGFDEPPILDDEDEWNDDLFLYDNEEFWDLE